MSKKIRPVERVDAQVTAPPSKSVTNRGLVIAALAAGESRLVDPLEAGDPDLLARALERLGIAVRRVPGTWT
ncbi:MAG: 3-phosphoshikimate 1-carboxyvinyltransferase, partial [Acidobacteriota bacterium]